MARVQSLYHKIHPRRKNDVTATAVGWRPARQSFFLLKNQCITLLFQTLYHIQQKMPTVFIAILK